MRFDIRYGYVIISNRGRYGRNPSSVSSENLETFSSKVRGWASTLVTILYRDIGMQ
jgi:hypothetical protein